MLSQPWHPLKKIAFRFFAIFLLLHTVEPLVGVLPLGNVLVRFIARIFFDMQQAPAQANTGSGDTTYNYALELGFLLLSILATIIWSVLDRRRPSYNKAFYWVTVVLRYYLGMVLIGYGFSKVFHKQMPSPFLYQLVQPMGDKSPMGLLWSYMGFSPAFSAITGWAEVIPGILLMFRRTALLGALMTVVVMFNVVVLNFCFDVPVKLFSSLLLLIALFLIAPELGRLINLLILNKPVEPRIYPVHLKKRWMRIKQVLRLAVISLLLFNNVSGYGARERDASSALKGIYTLSTMKLHQDMVPLLLTDSISWKQLVIEFPGSINVKTFNDNQNWFSMQEHPDQHTVDISDKSNKYTFNYAKDSTSLRLWNDSVSYTFKEQPISSFRLLNRGFHWISETPYNR
jgi:uncharacterized membrane protein YphA (DoxX/SURF4 family)